MFGKSASSVRHTARALWDALRALMVYETPGVAASIAYYSLFALLPATVVLIYLADTLMGTMSLHETVLQRILALFPGTRRALRANFEEITRPSASLILFCLLVTLWASSWVLMFVENALNRAWGVLKRRTFWQSRLRSFTLLSLCGVLLVASAALTAVVSALRTLAAGRVPEFARDAILNSIWSLLLLALGFSFAVLVFFLIYKLMPDRRVRTVEALSGALLASVLWEAASYLFAMLVPLFNYQRIYGTMGALIGAMTWVYTSTLIMLMGAHFSAQLHRPDIDQPELFRHSNRYRAGNVRVFSR